MSGRVGAAYYAPPETALSFRYRIDAPNRRATIVVEGIVSPKAFGETMDKLFADPAYRPQFDIIYDRRAVQAQPDPRNANQMVAYMKTSDTVSEPRSAENRFSR